jgi:hypothetical protein
MSGNPLTKIETSLLSYGIKNGRKKQPPMQRPGWFNSLALPSVKVDAFLCDAVAGIVGQMPGKA